MSTRPLPATAPPGYAFLRSTRGVVHVVRTATSPPFAGLCGYHAPVSRADLTATLPTDGHRWCPACSLTLTYSTQGDPR